MTQAQLIIETAEQRDARAIAEVHVTSWRETYRGLLPQGVLDGLSVDKRAQEWQQILGKGDSTNLVLRVKNQVVGFLSAGAARDLSEVCDAEIYALYVLKEYHGLRKGYELCQTYWERAKPENILFWVLEASPTRRFYEKLGGTIVGAKTDQAFGTTIREIAYCVHGHSAFAH